MSNFPALNFYHWCIIFVEEKPNRNGGQIFSFENHFQYIIVLFRVPNAFFIQECSE